MLMNQGRWRQKTLDFSFLNVTEDIEPATRSHRILIVDRNQANCHEMREALSGLNCELIEVQTTDEALAKIALQSIDLVIIDHLAPDLGGSEFCRILKRSSLTRFLPVFVVSSSDDVDLEVQAVTSGAEIGRAHV